MNFNRVFHYFHHPFWVIYYFWKHNPQKFSQVSLRTAASDQEVIVTGGYGGSWWVEFFVGLATPIEHGFGSCGLPEDRYIYIYIHICIHIYPLFTYHIPSQSCTYLSWNMNRQTFLGLQNIYRCRGQKWMFNPGSPKERPWKKKIGKLRSA